MSMPAASRAAADWDALGSPETYVGYARGERRTDRRADRLVLNQWARDVNLVLAPPATGASVRSVVRLDDQPPGDAHGVDVDESGECTVDEPRMYQLVRQPGLIR
jgi:hypothetical protein